MWPKWATRTEKDQQHQGANVSKWPKWPAPSVDLAEQPRATTQVVDGHDRATPGDAGMSAEPQTIALPVGDYDLARSIANFVAANRDLQFNEILHAIDARWPDVSFRTVYAALAIAVSEGYIASTEPRALC